MPKRRPMRRFPTRAAFEAWLEERRGLTVGVSRNERGCPLATFLCATTGAPMAIVRPGTFSGGYWWTPDMGVSFARLPGWAMRFGRAIDEPGKEVVGAIEALMVLRA